MYNAANDRTRQLRQDSTDAERLLWSRLRNRQLDRHKFVRQESIGPFIADFVCRESRLIVEVDGGQHADHARQDATRTAKPEALGYRVIRFWNNDVMSNTDGVLLEIAHALHHPSPQPSPREARGEGV